MPAKIRYLEAKTARLASWPNNKRSHSEKTKNGETTKPKARLSHKAILVILLIFVVSSSVFAVDIKAIAANENPAPKIKITKKIVVPKTRAASASLE